MSRIRKRLEEYKAELERQTQYKAGLPGSALDIVNVLLNDLEEDEKENEWIPCSERLPENETNVIANFSSGTVTELRHVANGIFHGIYEYSTKVIVAWRPLPERPKLHTASKRIMNEIQYQCTIIS